MTRPFFSIIVAAFNAEQLIRPTIDSVLAQDFSDYEIVVKDAASSDNTLAQIPKDDRIRVYSEKDGGIYDGMNQGVAYATGRYLLFLNCGDYLADPSVLSTVYACAKECDEANTIVYGDYRRGGVRAKQPGTLTRFYLYRTPLCHQTVFFGSGIFQNVGMYDTQYRILADYDLTLKSFTANANFVYCPCVVSEYLGGGVSESPKGRAIKREEYRRVRNTYFSAKEQKTFERRLKLSFKGFRQKLASDNCPACIRKLYRSVINLVNR